MIVCVLGAWLSYGLSLMLGSLWVSWMGLLVGDRLNSKPYTKLFAKK